MISVPNARSAQTVTLTCIWPTSPRRSVVCSQKTFPCRWYIWRKPCTYLMPILTPSPSRPKRAFTWPTSPWCSIGCTQNDFRAYWTFSANRAPILRQDEHYLQTDQKVLLLDPHHIGLQSGASKLIYEPMEHLAQTVHLCCVEINRTTKRTKTSFHLTHVT
jgi:hypothetical protein